ncbi:unnamed protein product [Adineta steineri]|uniref:NAD(P)(+)--arginine ADP-ribosyltransferase n=1 Tax=Adineta steineri TaxID=433720 RepID=A0A814URT7_9BILA|nr:unnamed protein product [Adineta steineri]CAF1387911.1 unnamed protein product [Adineta steineri]
MWQANPNPWSKSEPAKWSHYSDVENLIIEEMFSRNQPRAIFDRYYIDFKHMIQTFNDDHHKQRPVKRVECNKEHKHLREERFMIAPITAKRSAGGEYGWISPFIIEVRRDLGLKKNQLPSKDEKLIPELVEKAALGIIEEGTQIERRCEAEKLANLLREKKYKKFKEVWEHCAYLYSLESFLYKSLNEAMRSVGKKEHEQLWRSKIRTLGPFSLLLWDDPINKKVKRDTNLYRGAELKPEDIAMYKDLVKNPDEYRSFQAFTSCSRNRARAEGFGNTLFIIKVLFAFTADISSISQYKEEEEELVTPGVCFCVQNVQFDSKTNKHLITLQLIQRWSSKCEERFLDDFDTILTVFLNASMLTWQLIK